MTQPLGRQERSLPTAREKVSRLCSTGAGQIAGAMALGP